MLLGHLQNNFILQAYPGAVLHIKKIESPVLKGNIILPISKSIANRMLMICALSGSGANEPIASESHDINLLRTALFSDKEQINLEDAGTPLRFFLAYAALKRPGVAIDGNTRLRERPIMPLLEVLGQMGAEFEYLKKPGCLPLRIAKTIDTGYTSVEIDAGLSSQFLSASLLIAPYIENGLEIHAPRLTSAPYVSMTIDLMRKAGVKVDVHGEKYMVSPGGYKPQAIAYSEFDWSSAAHIYALASAAPQVDILLQGLGRDSVQGDKAVAEIFKHLGVITSEEEHGLRLTKGQVSTEELEVDFTDTPDLFPAVTAACAFHGVEVHFKGTRNLALKESDRVGAMKSNLAQMGCAVETISENEVRLSYHGAATDYSFKSFNDHRIAMACSIFAFRMDISIDDEAVVRKSFPAFWDVFFVLTSA